MARPRSPRGSGDKLRGELIAAANDILDRTRDPADVTVRGVAAAVGVAPTAVYLHFADRDTLLTEVVVDRFAAFQATLLAAVESVEDPLERLRRGHAAYCAFALEHPGHYRMLFGATGVDPARRDLVERRFAMALPAFQILVDFCRDCIDAGIFGPVDPYQLAGAIWAFEHGWVVLKSSGMSGGVVPSAEAALDVLLTALAGRAAGLDGANPSG